MIIKHLLRRGAAVVSGLFIALHYPSTARALQPDEIALIVNSAEPAGMELAKFYAAQRNIPDNRILVVDLPKTDGISTRQYEESLVPQVRDFLHSGNLETKVKCFVTFYGMPLRIDPRVNNDEESAELQQARAELIAMPPKIRPEIEAVEALTQKLDQTFVPNGAPDDLEQLSNRFNRAAKAYFVQIQTVEDKTRQAQLQVDFYDAAGSLLGKAGLIERTMLDMAIHNDTAPADLAKLGKLKADYQQAIAEAGKCEAVPYDPDSRAKLRQIVPENFGLLRNVKLLRDQVDYLDPDQSGSALDSELSLVEWTAYPHKAWITNPLHYGARVTTHQPVYMVMRLDAPTPELVKSLITNSIATEKTGLTGKVVIDTIGVQPGHEKPNQRGYGEYDQYLRNLHDTLQRDTKLTVVFDDKPEVLPANSADDVALYCGWYSVRNYVPSCKFHPGAVGFHIASYELVSLHGPGETGWVHGLMTDGISATLGPVAEPYLGAFPHPDEFFPVLLTGKVTLAETFWKTEPLGSWMISCIGDPLYTPYKMNPQLKPMDLPFRLRGIVTPAAGTAP